MRFKKEVEELSKDIEKRIFETLKPIDEVSAPKEIRPLINAINRLISYFEDRSQHEQDFSANASHELRTPLAGIRIQTEIAMSTDDKELQQKAHENILIAIDKNERLIDQLLTLARLTADRVELKMRQVNLSQLSMEEITNLQSLADEKHIDLKLVSSDTITLFANGSSISILLNNLIRNAINHTPERGEIQLKATTSKDQILLSVTDNGPGIPANKYEMVLQRFRKSGSAKSGSGLGLAIVKRICDLHNATLELDRDTKSCGLKVTVAFNCTRSGRDKSDNLGVGGGVLQKVV